MGGTWAGVGGNVSWKRRNTGRGKKDAEWQQRRCIVFHNKRAGVDKGNGN